MRLIKYSLCTVTVHAPKVVQQPHCTALTPRIRHASTHPPPFLLTLPHHFRASSCSSGHLRAPSLAVSLLTTLAPRSCCPGLQSWTQLYNSSNFLVQLPLHISTTFVFFPPPQHPSCDLSIIKPATCSLHSLSPSSISMLRNHPSNFVTYGTVSVP